MGFEVLLRVYREGRGYRRRRVWCLVWVEVLVVGLVVVVGVEVEWVVGLERDGLRWRCRSWNVPVGGSRTV